jgi:5'-3' exoribonuclease 2
MGVPAFFRWLSTRYPKAVIFALSEDELEYMHEQYRQEHHRGGDPNEIDLDGEENDFTALTQRKIQQKIRENNPEFDNLYLDMNGIIHPCTRASAPGQPEPNTLEEMFNNIFEYVDKVMRIVKPQRIIYMAIDGVAPRAKMN